MTALAPLAIAVPILSACLLLVAGRWLPRPVPDLVGLAAALAVGTLTGVLAAESEHGRVVSWIAGWTPHRGQSVGIVLVADPAGAGLACLSALLTAAALLYGWRYFADAHAHYQVLMSLFLAGMVGFCLTGDVFTMFVFFELMGAVAYALTGMRIEEPESVQGAVTFGVLNSLGAYLSLMGIGMLYARSGQLGMAQIAAALAGQRPDPLLVVAFTLLCCGLLVKAAMVPLHFWLADAHAVAPTPVCVLFSGVMVELGVYAVLRVYWTVFGPTVPASSVHGAFVAFGVLTAVLGAVLCAGQRHLKRMLAYSTVAHVGLFLLGFAALDPGGVAGIAVYVAGHAGTKGALFLLVGILLNRYGSVDERELHGRAGGRNLACWLFLAGGLSLAGTPPAGPGLGKAILEHTAESTGGGWLVAVYVGVSALTGGTVLRAGLRVFLGVGRAPQPVSPAEETTGEREEPETTDPLRRTPVPMLVAPAVLLAGAVAVGAVPAFGRAAAGAAGYLTDRAGYLAQVLHGAPAGPVERPDTAWTTAGVLLGVLSAVLAALVAGLAVARLPRRVTRRGAVARVPLRLLHRLHSGHVGDYVAWLFAGTAVLGVLLAVPLLR